MKEDQKEWNQKYRGRKFTRGQPPNPFLKKHIRLLPQGKALDIASGDGRNAVFLAEHGFHVEAVDISSIGLGRARKLARSRGVQIETIQADLDTYPLAKEKYDLIVDFYFLDRRLIPRIKEALKKGGRIVFETYTIEQKSLGYGPTNPKYLLKPNELLRLFKGFRILSYREGIFKEGGIRKAIASLIAMKD